MPIARIYCDAFDGVETTAATTALVASPARN